MIQVRFFFYEVFRDTTVPVTAEGARQLRETWGKPHFTTRWLPVVPRVGEWVNFAGWGAFKVKEVINAIDEDKYDPNDESFSAEVYLDSGSYRE